MSVPREDDTPYNLLYEDWLLQSRRIDAEIARTDASDATRLQALAGHSLVARVGLLGTVQASGMDMSVCTSRMEKEAAKETHQKAVRSLLTARMDAIIHCQQRRQSSMRRQATVREEPDVEAFLEAYPECRKAEADESDDETSENGEEMVPTQHASVRAPVNVYPTMDYQSQQHQQQTVAVTTNPYHAQSGQYPPQPPPHRQQHQQPPPTFAPPTTHLHTKTVSSASSWNDQQHGVGQNPFQTATEYARAGGGGEPLKEQQQHSRHVYPQPPSQQQPQQQHYNPYAANHSNSPPPPPAPMIRESLKRKYQLPVRIGAGDASSSSNNNSNVNRNNSSSNGQRGLTNSAQTNATASAPHNTDNPADEEELPEPLQRFGKELVDKIRSEIMDAGETITFHDIAGLEDAKQTVQEVVVWPMIRPDLFTGLRRAPNGVLLYGPPGTGKTLIGKAIAHESGATFFSISSSSLTSKWIGEGEKLVRTLFAVAAYYEPSVVFVDEIDSLLTQRKADENEASRRIKTEFLVQLDGTGTGGQGRVLMIGATNRPQELDDAARRRFTKRLYIPLPEEGDREVLLRVLLERNKHGLSDAEIQKLAKDTAGFSGADLKALCTDAAMGPIRALGARALEVDCNEVPPIVYKHFRQSLRSMNPSVAPSDLEQYLAWDEMYGNKRAAPEDDTDEDDAS